MTETNRLLVLDDDPAVARTIALIAQRSGFAVRQCGEPEEFFRAIHEWAPTHIALDLVMPTMDGVEVLRALARVDCRAHIIVTSGMGDGVLELAQRSALERGLSISGILPKPFSPDMLRRLLINGDAACRSGVPEAPTDYAVTEQEIEQALVEGQFQLHYQPKIELANGTVTGFEALLRWRHPRHGLLYPDQFIGLAERSGAIERITWQTIAMGLDWLAQVRAGGEYGLSLNLSALCLKDLGLADWLARMCTERAIDHGCVTLELTETATMANRNDASDILTRLRIKGFPLAIDDFGIGYSSMTCLAELPFSELKIDKSFVLRMTGSENARKIVEATIHLAKNLGLRTVGEGVEDADTLRMLRELGCDWGQGYLIARPMAGERARRWLRGYRP